MVHAWRKSIKLPVYILWCDQDKPHWNRTSDISISVTFMMINILQKLHKLTIECFVLREYHAPGMKRLPVPATASYEQQLVGSVQRIISESIKYILF
jgi:hypothetical protein